MKLVQKLKLFFYPAFVLPVLLMIFFSLVIFHGYFSTVYDLDEAETGIWEYLNPLSLQNELVQDIYDDLTMMAEKNPDRLLSLHYLERTGERLSSSNSYLILKMNGETVYRSDRTEGKKIEEDLPEYHEKNAGNRSVLYTGRDEDYLVRQVNFMTGDGEKGSIYILSDLNAFMKHYRNILFYVALAGIGILLLINMAVSGFIKRGFLEPLKILKDGIDQIRYGNLDQDIPVVREDEIGEVARSFNEMRDRLKVSIDERMRYEEANRILISNISHDLKTPITAIKGYVEGIMDGVAKTPEMMNKYIKTIYTKAEAMDHMINELSIYSKIDSDTIPYNFKRLNLDSFFIDCMDDMAIDLERRNIKIEYDNTCPKEMNVIADAEQLKRVIMNIIINAIKYNDKEIGKIMIRIRREEDFARVEIEDNGIGIDEKDIPLIFNRLYRADRSRSSRYGGTGIGLSIAKKIINEHGGKIWAEQAEDNGLIILFTLEIEKAE